MAALPRALQGSIRTRVPQAFTDPRGSRHCGLSAGKSTRCARSRGSMAQCRAQAASAIDPDNASILVCGGGGVALSVTRQLKDMGSWVWMLQRSTNRQKEIEEMKAVFVQGDALDKATLKKAFDGIEEVDAVVSTVGSGISDPEADGQGNINIIEAALEKGVKKFILVTSLGCGDSKDGIKQQIYDALKPVLLEKNKAEQKLKDSSSKLTYVIIRPGGLLSNPATEKGFLSTSNMISGSITREDVAKLVVKALFSSKTDNKVFTALDEGSMAEDQPPFEKFEI